MVQSALFQGRKTYAKLIVETDWSECSLVQHKHSAVSCSHTPPFWSVKPCAGIYIHVNTTLSTQGISAVYARDMLSWSEQMRFPLFYFSRYFHLWPALSLHREENRKCCDIYLTAYVSFRYLCWWRTVCKCLERRKYKEHP